MSMPSKKRARNVRHNDIIATETWSFFVSRRAFTGLLKMSSSPIVLLGTTSCGSVLSGRWMKNRCTGQTIRSWTTILGPQEVKLGFGNHYCGSIKVKKNHFGVLRSASLPRLRGPRDQSRLFHCVVPGFTCRPGTWPFLNSNCSFEILRPLN